MCGGSDMLECVEKDSLERDPSGQASREVYEQKSQEIISILAAGDEGHNTS